MIFDLHLQKRGTPYYIQLRDQISHAICTGRLKSGDRLPTVRELGEQFGISRNTALRAYQELQRDGWIRNTPRSGTFVQSLARPGSAAPDLSAEALRRFHDALDHIHTLGPTAETVCALTERFIAERWSSGYTDADFCLMVTEDTKGAETDVADIQAATGIPTKWVPLADLRAYGVWALGDIRRLRLVIALFYRYAEVRERIGALAVPVMPITPTTDSKVMAEAAKYNRPDVRVAVVAHDPGYIQALSFLVSQSLYRAQTIGSASLGDADAVRELVERADVVAANFWAAHEQHTELTLNKPTIALGTRVDPNSLQSLRQALEAGHTA